MVIYLRHPVHGYKVAIAEFEAEHDKANGWEVYDPEALTPETPKAHKGRKPKESEVPSFLQ